VVQQLFIDTPVYSSQFDVRPLIRSDPILLPPEITCARPKSKGQLRKSPALKYGYLRKDSVIELIMVAYIDDWTATVVLYVVSTVAAVRSELLVKQVKRNLIHVVTKR
jgi:hypothetical protein